MSRLLRGAGMLVTEATSGAEALARLAESVPLLVVLDVNLPDISGHEVCRRIKQGKATEMVSVMHITASYLTNADRAYGLEQGADAYLTHPLDPDVLLATARALLRASRADWSPAGWSTYSKTCRRRQGAHHPREPRDQRHQVHRARWSRHTRLHSQ